MNGVGRISGRGDTLRSENKLKMDMPEQRVHGLIAAKSDMSHSVIEFQ
jgi:hypothetical protein